MWEHLARSLIHRRWYYLVALGLATLLMGREALQVQMGYEFTRAIPTDNPKYQTYQEFRKKFGEDGNLVFVILQSENFFKRPFFTDYARLGDSLQRVQGVDQVLSIPRAVNLERIDSAEKFISKKIFDLPYSRQAPLDSAHVLFAQLPFYQSLLYNPQSQTYLMAITVNRGIMNSARRNEVVSQISQLAENFGRRQGVAMHLTGLPLIRTNMATKVAGEMKGFLLASVLLSAAILLAFFRSLSTMALSLSVVLIGVVFSLGTMHLLDYKISLISVLIPPLMVVIGIPNCIYFLNKYHTAYQEKPQKEAALIEMVRRMGVVTLFCNISAAIGFGVFAFTRSAILKEFGVVSGINILLLFFVSLILIPGLLSFLPPPKNRHTRYLENRWLQAILDRLEIWALNHKAYIYGITAAVVVLAVAGMLRLRSEGFMLDDLPKDDPIFTDLKFAEKNFKGIMPLEIIVDTKRKNGLRSGTLKTINKIDSFCQYIGSRPEMNRPLALTEGLKFVRQAYYRGDSANYRLPTEYDLPFLAPYLNLKSGARGPSPSPLSRLLTSFIDTARQQTRISVNMADVGTLRLPGILQDLQTRSSEIFDTAHYRVEFTGTSVTFLEGSAFIIRGLQESIFWAFLLIALCMLYLFRSWRILLCSLLPNLIPLVVTAGVMGWIGVPLKPSTVLVFSIALGIAIDITIRFLVNFKQDRQMEKGTVKHTVVRTIHHTGISILYTSMVLIAGFGIFCFSGFGGTQALGWLTSLTLVMATLTNLIFLPALLISINRKNKDLASFDKEGLTE